MEKYLLLETEDHEIPAILTYPDCADKVPAIILCHGTASNKDEVGNLFKDLANQLLEHNIACLRIDFVGFGDSKEDESSLTFLNEVEDAYKAYTYLKELTFVDSNKLGILGFSQGARVMAELLNRAHDFGFAISWSGTCHNGIGHFQSWFDEYYKEASLNGVAMMKMDWREDLPLSKVWFDEIRDTKPMEGIKNFKNPILAIAGTDDVVVPWKHAEEIIDNSTHKDSRSLIISGADHIYNVLSNDHSIATMMLNMTVDWILSIIKE